MERQARQGKKAQAMNKVYIQVQELLREYGVQFDELLQFVKSGKLTLYTMPRPYEYEAIASFDCFVDDFIARKRKRLEKQYIANMDNIHFPSERIARARAISDSIRERWQGQRTVRQIGVDEIISQNHKKALQSLADREGVARGLAICLYVKSCDYENVANIDKPQGKRGPYKDPEKPNRTLKACNEVQKECFSEQTKFTPYSRKRLETLVTQKLNEHKKTEEWEKLHQGTFSCWYTEMTKLGYARKQGNPKLAKKPA